MFFHNDAGQGWGRLQLVISITCHFYLSIMIICHTNYRLQLHVIKK